MLGLFVHLQQVQGPKLLIAVCALLLLVNASNMGTESLCVGALNATLWAEVGGLQSQCF